VVIDLNNDVNWRWRFFGGPKQDKDGRLFQAKGEIALDNFPDMLVVRNAPDDTLLMNQLLEWQKSKKDKTILLERGLPQSEIDQNRALKSAAKDFAQMMRQYTCEAPVCLVNSANISQVLQPHTSIDEERRLVERPSFLQHTIDDFGRPPVIWVAEELQPEQWDQLLQHPQQFSIATDEDIAVPEAYQDLVAKIKKPKQHEFPLPANIADATRRVNFILSADPELTVKNWCGDGVKRLDVTPILRSDEMIYKWKVNDKTDAQQGAAGVGAAGVGAASADAPQGLPDCRIQLHQLLRDLHDGTDVVIHNLEKNPELAQHLATLTNPPYYVDVDGQRLVVSQAETAG